MSESDLSTFPLYLRAKQPDNSENETIGRRFREIVERKGHFRTVNQASLLADEDEDADLQQNGEVTANEDEDVEEERGTLKHINASKQKMLLTVSEAHNQAMYMVDFISLLESKYSEAGERSMSQGLKQSVPPKSLAYDQWPAKDPDEAEQTMNSMAAQGQRLKGLTTAADVLLKAASRLQEDVRRETIQWEEILSVTDDGWAVCQVRKGQHQLGVQLGFPQAGPLFRYRGFVPLDSGEGGTLRLGQRAASRPRKLRLRIFQNGKLSGSTATGRVELEDASIEDRIRAARDSLFEEELFHEMTSEAQFLMAYGPKWADSTIHIPLDLIGGVETTNGELLIDLVPQDHRELPSAEPHADEYARRVLLALEVLMLQTFKQRLEEASKPPAPLSERKHSPQIAKLLRPLLTQGCHHSAVTQLRRYLDVFHKILDHAKLDTSSPSITTTPTLSGPMSEDLLNSLTGPCTTDVRIPLPSAKGEVNITIRTEIPAQKPLLGYTVTVPRILQLALDGVASDRESAPVKPKQANLHRAFERGALKLDFESHEELVSYLNELWALDIAHNVIASQEGATAREQEPEVTATLVDDNGKTKGGVRLRVLCSVAGLLLFWKMTHVKGAAGDVRWTTDSEGVPSLGEAVETILKEK